MTLSARPGINSARLHSPVSARTCQPADTPMFYNDAIHSVSRFQSLTIRKLNFLPSVLCKTLGVIWKSAECGGFRMRERLAIIYIYSVGYYY